MSRGKSVVITFKNNEDYLYEEICKHPSKSAFIKEILMEHMKTKKENQEKLQNCNNQKNKIDKNKLKNFMG